MYYAPRAASAPEVALAARIVRELLNFADDADYQARLATLRALFAPGPHTYVATVRGATVARTWTFISQGDYTVPAFKLRQFTASGIVPAPPA